MIVPMKKIAIVVQEKDILPAVEALGRLGLVHVVHGRVPTDDKVESLRGEVQTLEKAIFFLSQLPGKAPTDRREGQGEVSSEDILQWVQRRDAIAGEMHARKNEMETWTPWGAFDPEDVRWLAGQGVKLDFLELKPDELTHMPAGVVFQEIFRRGKAVFGVSVTRFDAALPGTRLSLPAKSVAVMKQEQAEDQEELADMEARLRAAADQLETLQKNLQAARDTLTFYEVHAGRGDAGPLCYLQGYCPAEKVPDLEAEARRQSWAMQADDPSAADAVPTLMRNPAWVEISKPVFEFVNVFPGYRELDVSPVFLIFLSIFVGILIGDAAYGAFMLLAAAGVHIFKGKAIADKKALYIFYVFAGTTILWGGLTGTYFGQQWLTDSPLRPWVPSLTDYKNVQQICFVIGAVHLSVARIWRMILKFPSLSFLAEAGWVPLIWGIFFIARSLVLGENFPSFAGLFFIIGGGGVLFFSQPSRNIFKTLGLGLGSAMGVINAFSDIVSYIRLFAVGLASVAVADAFNSIMAPLPLAAKALFLPLAHGFNFVLGLLAILVHGLRLNVMEFSNHIGLEWTGTAYRPFRRTR